MIKSSYLRPLTRLESWKNICCLLCDKWKLFAVLEVKSEDLLKKRNSRNKWLDILWWWISWWSSTKWGESEVSNVKYNFANKIIIKLQSSHLILSLHHPLLLFMSHVCLQEDYFGLSLVLLILWYCETKRSHLKLMMKQNRFVR